MRIGHRIVGLVVLTIALATHPVTAQQLEDVIYLNDGSILRGVITEQIPGQSVLIQTRDGNVFRITMERISRMTRESRPGQSMNGREVKSPGGAFLLSFLVPGAGQAYNGQYVKAGVQFLITTVGTLWLIDTWEDCWEYDQFCVDWGIAAVLGFGGRFWSWVDAPASANAINRRALALEIGPRVTVARLAVPTTSVPGMPVVSRRLGINIGLARITF